MSKNTLNQARSPAKKMLFAAASRLEAGGWCLGPGIGYGQAEGPTCALGAIVFVGGPRFGVARDALKAHLGIHGVTVWNDSPGRTAKEVIGALRSAARAS